MPDKKEAVPIANAQISSTSYFANEEGLVEEFAFDYDTLNDFDQRVIAVGALPGGLLMLLTGIPCGLCYPCYALTFESKNVADRNNATHVCITRDGIRFSVDKRKTGCRYSMCDQGKTTKTVPFDKITDCDIEEPAGNTGCCWLVKNVITVVNVDTASVGGGGHELQIRGLVDPHGFKKLVWQMKRSGHGTPHSNADTRVTAPSQVQMTRVGTGNPKSVSELAPLLLQQNRLLEKQNQVLSEHTNLLQKIANK
jgi:hypothetical protein